MGGPKCMTFIPLLTHLRVDLGRSMVKIHYSILPVIASSDEIKDTRNSWFGPVDTICNLYIMED